MGLYRSNVIVLRTRNLGEADRILVLLGEDIGKFEAVVKGARRQRSRFVGNTLPFNYLNAQFFTGKNLDSLSQAELIRSFTMIHDDLVKLTHASFWTELVDTFLPERQEANEIFKFLLAAFLVLETTPDIELVSLAFQIRLLDYLGYQPQIDGCISCGAANAEIVFSAEAGGVICKSCSNVGEYRDLIPFTVNDGRIFLTLARTDLRELPNLSISPVQRQTIRNVLRGFIDHRLDKPLKSQLFLDQMPL